ncbi:NADPH-dependent FMN reductase [Ectobacillus ponti]|uniref:NAD(P)H-dependent oxidoreductase n=1 Tax=Ectobacillus ponti TaxID=2961894 RepID=A0AA41X8X2_9BACI|nr:NAD(P)H-dependent oxidoreductase [Ectobacillus ponti]MCP8971069.1 NAD(P)H-dependent oxidoreductase [Ectobacillus ponti]
MLVIGICGSSASSRRTRALVEEALAGARLAGGVETDIIDLSEVTLDFCDGRAAEAYSTETQRVLERMRDADAYIFGSPMYRGSMTGALKNLIDLLPDAYIKGKTAGLAATGGSDHHYLGLDLGFRTAMSFFRVHTIPGILYQSRFTVEDGRIVEQKVREQAEQFGRDVVQLAQMTEGRVLGPALY